MNVMNELEKYQTSHPTFVHLWTMYIDRKKTSYEKTLETCSNLFPKLENMNDKDMVRESLKVVHHFILVRVEQ